MLRLPWFDPLLDSRAEDQPPPREHKLPRRPLALRLRRHLGHGLIAAGRVIAGEARPVRPVRRRAY